MRELKRGERLTGRRERARRRYADHMASSQWRQRRKTWMQEHQEREVGPPTCAVCSDPWEPKRDDLHHHDYSRLGRERFEDLVPLCRDDHDAVHEHMRSKNWRRHGHAAASRSIVARLKAARRHTSDPSTEPTDGGPE